MNTTVDKLDALAEYHSQKDSLDAKKRALMDEVKVPEEINQLIAGSNKIMAKYDQHVQKKIKAVNDEVEVALKAIVIPEEIKAALAEIDRKRALVEKYRQAKQAEIMQLQTETRNANNERMQEQTKKIFDDLAKRKADIEAEFSGKLDAVDENIKSLEAEIKKEAKDGKETVKGKYFMAVYVKGRVTWNTEGLDKYADQHPEVAYFRKEGEPSITLRRM